MRCGLSTRLDSVLQKKLRRVAKAGAAQSKRLGSLAAAWEAHTCQGDFLVPQKDACSFSDSPLVLDSMKWGRFVSLQTARTYTVQTKEMEKDSLKITFTILSLPPLISKLKYLHEPTAFECRILFMYTY